MSDAETISLIRREVADALADPKPAGTDRLAEVLHAGLRGAVAAMAMTGARAFMVHAGLVEQPPPHAIFEQRARRLLRLVPRRERRAAIELAHWG